VKIKKNKDKRCPIGMNGPQEEPMHNVVINVNNVVEDELGISSQVYY